MQSSTVSPKPDVVFSQGDIVWAQYPLTDKVDKLKRRPVLIVSNQDSNRLDLDYIVVPITRTVRNEPLSLAIQLADVEADLPVIGELRCNKPFTIRYSLLFDRIGVLSTEKTMLAIQLVGKAIAYQL
jgi:mRNA-degrading endonuclease toxin of MazEF toxin-antitoxin module